MWRCQPPAKHEASKPQLPWPASCAGAEGRCSGCSILHASSRRYVFNEGPFDSVFSFTILSLFNTLRFPLVVLPKALRGTSGARTSVMHMASIWHLRCAHPC